MKRKKMQTRPLVRHSLPQSCEGPAYRPSWMQQSLKSSTMARRGKHPTNLTEPTWTVITDGAMKSVSLRSRQEKRKRRKEYNDDGHDAQEHGGYRRWTPGPERGGAPEVGAAHISDAECVNQHDFEGGTREAYPRLMEAAPDLSGPSSSRSGSTLTAEMRSFMVDVRGSL